jgi:hypothetical protein
MKVTELAVEDARRWLTEAKEALARSDSTDDQPHRGFAMSTRFTKIGAEGETLADDATEWAAVLDKTTSLLWTVKETKRLTWDKARAAVAKLDSAGFKDWRLPTVEELFLLADRTRVSLFSSFSWAVDCYAPIYRC